MFLCLYDVAYHYYIKLITDASRQHIVWRTMIAGNACVLLKLLGVVVSRELSF